MKNLWPDTCTGDRLPPIGHFNPDVLDSLPPPVTAVVVEYRERKQSAPPAVTNIQEAIAYIHEQRDYLKAQRRIAVENLAGFVPSDFRMEEDGFELVEALLTALLKKYTDNPDISWKFVHKPGLETALNSLYAQYKGVDPLDQLRRDFHREKKSLGDVNFELYEHAFRAEYNPETISAIANRALVSRIVSYFGLNKRKSEVIQTRSGVRFDHQTHFTNYGSGSYSNNSSREHFFMMEAVGEILLKDGKHDLATEVLSLKDAFPYYIDFPFEKQSASGNFSFKAYKNGRVSYVFTDAAAKSVQIFLAKHWNQDS